MFNKARKKISNIFRDKVKQTLRDNNFTNNYLPFNKTAGEYVIKKSFKDYPLCEFGLPIPPVDLRSGYETDNKDYIEFAKQDVENMNLILSDSGFDLKDRKNKKILDFGCGSGRMIRCMKPYSETSEIWGTDVSANHIYWNNKYLNPPFYFATNTFNPHLPFEDKYFDLIYSGSVFTHIDNLFDSWLLELKRILSENGRLYVTIHDNFTVNKLDKSTTISLAKYLKTQPFFDEAKNDYDLFVMNRPKSPLVFFDLDYFKKLVKPVFEIISVNKESYGYQTGILLKRKN